MISKSKEKQLIRACKRCEFRTVQNLISNAKSQPKSKYSRSYHEANQMIHNIQYLDVNCREPRFQMTPLMIASLRGSRDIVLALIQAGASPTIRDVKGNTALQLACMKQRFHVVDALLQNKSNPNDVNISGWNCLISAVNYFHEDSAIMLLLLLQTGTKVDHKDKSGLTPIDHAVKKNKINAIRVILNYNIKAAHTCVRALVNAVIKGYFNIVLLLLNYGVNPNKVDIITGTGPLHEAVRYNDIKDEKTRQERIKIVRFLALYGADPELVNVKRETPMQLALQKPDDISAQYVEAMKEFYKLPHMKPKFITMTSNAQNELTHSCNYPLLRPLSNWTRNDPKYCSSYIPGEKNDLVTNLIDGDPTSMWQASGHSLSWAIFDLKADHLVNKLRIYSWNSKEMPKELYLQVSNSLEGPWSCVQSFKCDMIGSSLRKSAGVPVEIEGFCACARFWRLVTAKNHGSPITSFHGVEFFGYDNRISKLLEQLKLTEYEQALIENDLNQIESLMNCSYDKFESLPIPDAHDKETLWHFILEFQKKVQPLKRLEWFNEPVPFCLVGQNLPAFSVTSTAFLTNTLQLISHGGGIIEGETFIDMEPGGMYDPSMAIYRNISFANSGKFLIEIRSKRDHQINISSQPIQIFEAGDPEYERLLKLYPKFGLGHNPHKKLPRQGFGSDIDSDDDTLDQIYGFADFTEQTSKMKINKWLSKSQDDEDEIDEHDGDEIPRRDNHYDTNYTVNSSPRQVHVQTSPDLLEQRKNQQEYEVQSFTLEFNDDLTSLSSFNGGRRESKSFPKSEARVYVNNPDIFEVPNAKQLTQVVTPRDSYIKHTEVKPQPTEVKTPISLHQELSSQVKYTTYIENPYERISNTYKPINNLSRQTSEHKSPSSAKKPIAPRVSIQQQHQPQVFVPPLDFSPPDYNQPSDEVPEEYDLPSPVNLTQLTPPPAPPLPETISSASNEKSPSPILPPPPPPIVSELTTTASSGGAAPPPPPPPAFLFDLNQPKDGLLKFQKTKPATNQVKPSIHTQSSLSKKKLDSPMNDLQRELEKKLVSVKKTLDAEIEPNHQERKYSAIHHFDPEFITGPKEVSFNQDMAPNNLEELNDKENVNRKTSFDFDPRETFTSKAKEALEKYKIARSTSSNSVSEHSANSSVDMRSVVKSQNKRHAPLPFQINQS